MVKQSRDGNRMAELQSINKALLVYQSFGGSSSMGTYNIIYISLSDSDSQCGSYYGTLSATSTGWNYHCSPEADYRKTDGNGWIPVDLTSVESSSGALFASLPIDPNNTATSQHYYTYIPGSWALSTLMESTKYLAANATADGGWVSTRFEVGNNLSLNIAVNCGGFDYEGQRYAGIQIGTQCWMAENLNVGTMITSCDGGYVGACTNNSETPQDQGTSCSSIKKYCYHDDEAYCTSKGAWYQWDQAMCGSTSAGAQGICPDGWHVPADSDWHILEEYLKDDGQACNPARNGTYECIPAATELKVGGSSSFNALYNGRRFESGLFSNDIINGVYLWTSSQYDTTRAPFRFMYSSYSGTRRDAAVQKAQGLGIRCVKD
jgi:uncharacterized protein (TIGR02145 family)